ncbi:heparinase II/III family protein [Acinetobacter pseudolwoffii]|uniref:heparinase II/III family protein n=1 Tax=Acinetobacter pseudolwoffii TaxID=2053287 RepID=UPI002468BB6D|nr:alginate lyase family protein [Acinetobacter pseudolwoffii]MDH5820406.1 alginate lyase family protein [Acinetobacter pseudolwoffii]
MKLLKLIHTIKYLKFVQLFYRLHYLLLKPKTKQIVFKTQLRHVAQNWENAIAKPISMLSPTHFLFLNHPGHLNTAEDWNSNQQEKLWLYNLHYFDDLNAENASDRVEWHKNTIQKWIAENPYPIGNGWEPYPNSLRIVNWIKWSLQGNPLDQAQLNSLALQAEHLSKTVEWHILANHLFANAKALIFAGLYFDTHESKKWLELGLKIYSKEIDEQVLDDGANFELTPMYHAIFLEDLLDIYQVAQIYKKLDLIHAQHLQNKIVKMLNWLSLMSHPDGEISFFNDATFGIASCYEKLSKYAEKLGIAVSDSNLDDCYLKPSGYLVVQRPAYKFIMDVAEVGPSYQPGHAHADTLSFELSINDARFIVNSGISQYGLGKERLLQRGTATHNTVEIDSENSSEIWSGFRVARRVSPQVESIDQKGNQIHELVASYKSLKGAKHHRSVTFHEQKISLTDKITGQFHQAISYLYFHPDVQIQQVSSNEYQCKLANTTVYLHLDGQIDSQLLNTLWHPEFGKSIDNLCLKIFLKSGECKINMTIMDVDAENV